MFVYTLYGLEPLSISLAFYLCKTFYTILNRNFQIVIVIYQFESLFAVYFHIIVIHKWHKTIYQSIFIFVIV